MRSNDVSYYVRMANDRTDKLISTVLRGLKRELHLADYRVENQKEKKKQTDSIIQCSRTRGIRAIRRIYIYSSRRRFYMHIIYNLL